MTMIAKARRRIPWKAVKRVAGVAFVVLVAVLIFRALGGIDWAKVWQGLKGYDARTLLPAAGLACLSFLLHASFDLLGRHYTRHHLSTLRVMLTAFIAYIFNLNIGAVVGGLGVRLRLYSKAEVSGSQVAWVYTIAIVTNWTGYMLIAGIVFSLYPPTLPPAWGISELALRGLGVLMFLAGLAYWLACAKATRRRIKIRGHVFSLPSLRFALLQSALSITNWITLAAIINLLLPKEVNLPAVLSVLLIGSVAGALAHIPAGLGVLETVFVLLLGNQVPQHTLLAALIVYRALYYLIPMVFASALYAWMEMRTGPPQPRTDSA